MDKRRNPSGALNDLEVTMRVHARFAAVLIALSLPLDPAGAQTPVEAIPRARPPLVAPLRAAPPEGGAVRLDPELPFTTPTEPRESAGPATVIFSAMATGIFFGAIAGGIYGDSREGCDGCDFYGAVSGGFLGGLVGLITGVAISVR